MWRTYAPLKDLEDECEDVANQSNLCMEASLTVGAGNGGFQKGVNGAGLSGRALLFGSSSSFYLTCLGTFANLARFDLHFIT